MSDKRARGAAKGVSSLPRRRGTAVQGPAVVHAAKLVHQQSGHPLPRNHVLYTLLARIPVRETLTPTCGPAAGRRLRLLQAAAAEVWLRQLNEEQGQLDHPIVGCAWLLRGGGLPPVPAVP